MNYGYVVKFTDGTYVAIGGSTTTHDINQAMIRSYQDAHFQAGVWMFNYNRKGDVVKVTFLATETKEEETVTSFKNYDPEK